MPRKELYRLVRGAFIHLYLSLTVLALTVAAAAVLGERPSVWLFPALAAADLAVALWAKRGLFLDLLAGRTEGFCGQIDHREGAGSLRCVRVEYLVEAGSQRPRCFVHFPEALPLSPEEHLELLAGSAELRYLPRSLVVVGVKTAGEAAARDLRPWTKEWYRQKPRLEAACARASRVIPCPRLREYYWFWETLSGLLFLVFGGLFLLFYLP